VVQQEALQKILRDLDRLEELALQALHELDQTDWPEEARAATPVLARIEIEDDEDTLAGRFVFEYAAAEDPEADYYVEFQNGEVVDASRIA
jgi:hypothetical protein